jgi:hypothetical protein
MHMGRRRKDISKPKRIPGPPPKDPFAFRRHMGALADKADRGETIDMTGMSEQEFIDWLNSVPVTRRLVSSPY